MSNLFVKCGGNDYEYFKHLLKMEQSSWIVYIFDPILRNDESWIHHNTKAVWTEATTLSFCYDKIAPEASSFSHLHQMHSECEMREIQTMDFSQFIENNKKHKIYCVMDIEGAEYAVLKDLIERGTIRHIHHLWIRWHYVRNENHDDLMDILTKLIKVEIF